jgi:hypothetical protein
MSWPAIDTFRRWVSKRKGLLTGLLGVAVEEVVDIVPGGKLALGSSARSPSTASSASPTPGPTSPTSSLLDRRTPPNNSARSTPGWKR